MTIGEMINRKRELGYTNERIAELSGIPLGTVQKIFAGTTKAPRRGTIEALERVLCEPAAFSYPHASFEETKLLLREAAPAYVLPREKQQGDYTIADYYAIPDDHRVELIDGVIYDMTVPTTIHQMVLGQLYLLFAACVEAHPDCELYFAPVDVRLDRDNRTMVQPDLLIVCRDSMDTTKFIDGAPEFVLEVLSPSNPGHDRIRKLNKYWNAGVKEYWIADPDSETVRVYCFEKSLDPVCYSFTDSIPVSLSAGECVIDMTRIHEKMKKYRG